MAKKKQTKTARKAATKKVAPKKVSASTEEVPEVQEEVAEELPNTNEEPEVQVEPEKVTQEVTKPTKKSANSVKLPEALKTYLHRTLLSYFTEEGLDDTITDTVYASMEAGLQPFVVAGKGNFRFGIEVVEETFDPYKPETDATCPGSMVNLSRAAVNAKKYPTTK